MSDTIPDETPDESKNIPEELTITLRKPVRVGKEDVTEIRLTEPTMKQLRESAKAGGGLDSLARLIELNAKVLPMVVDGMVRRDIEAAGAFFGRFGSDGK